MITGEYHASRPVFLEWLAEYLTEQGIEDAGLWEVLYKELLPFRHPTVFRFLTRFAGGEKLLGLVPQLERALHHGNSMAPQVRRRSPSSSSQEGEVP